MHADKQTIVFALTLLDTTYSDVWKRRIGKHRETQMAYYNGMKLMAEVMLSNVYKTEIHIDVDSEGKHSLHENIEREVPEHNAG